MRRSVYKRAVIAVTLVIFVFLLWFMGSSMPQKSPKTGAEPRHKPVLVLAGDSHAARFESHGRAELAKLEEFYTVYNYGQRGTTSAQTVEIMRHMPADADVVVLLTGTNDYLQGLPRENVSANVEAIRSLVAPARLLWIDTWNLTAWPVKLAPDGHLTPEGYAWLGERIARELR